MYFNKAYDVICSVDPAILQEISDNIQNDLQEDDYTYQDVDSKSKERSWSRVDFSREPDEIHLKPLYNSITKLVDAIKSQYNIFPVSSVSVSKLNPLQILEEHTDGRLIHRITDRYLVPLMHSEVNYNYGYYNNEKIEYKLEYGKVFRINNAIIHSALNLENQDRYNILIDTFDTRLQEKFINHPDLHKRLNIYSVNYYFEKNRTPKTKPRK